MAYGYKSRLSHQKEPGADWCSGFFLFLCKLPMKRAASLAQKQAAPWKALFEQGLPGRFSIFMALARAPIGLRGLFVFTGCESVFGYNSLILISKWYQTRRFDGHTRGKGICRKQKMQTSIQRRAVGRCRMMIQSKRCIFLLAFVFFLSSNFLTGCIAWEPDITIGISR